MGWVGWVERVGDKVEEKGEREGRVEEVHRIDGRSDTLDKNLMLARLWDLDVMDEDEGRAGSGDGDGFLSRHSGEFCVLERSCYCGASVKGFVDDDRDD